MSSSMIREQIRTEIKSIIAFDDLERRTKQDILTWIDSGAALCRTRKPNVPDKHLVSYFVLVDGEYLLLVDHINAQLWLPTGGHVELGEHPKTTAMREMEEELRYSGSFLHQHPILLTSTLTVGKTAGHTDVSLWYAIQGDRRAPYEYARNEFYEIRWFHRNEIPWDRTDPELHRFVAKLFARPLNKV